MLLFLSADLFQEIISGTLLKYQMVLIQNVGSDLGPNCMRRISGVDKSRR